MSLKKLKGSIAFIPARGGSKRLPKKNLLKLEGKTFIQRAIETAFEAKIFERVFFSTDNLEMLNEGKKYTDDCIMRSSSLGKDDITLTKVLVDFIKTKNIVDKKICMLMPNCPLRNSKDIINTGIQMITQNAEASMSVVSYGWRPPRWALFRDTNDFIKPVSELIDLKKIKNKKLFCPTGAVRWVNTKSFIKNRSFYPKRLSCYELPWFRAVDIDYFEDFNIANLIIGSKSNVYRF